MIFFREILWQDEVQVPIFKMESKKFYHNYSLPDYIIVVPEKESLPSFPHVVHNPHTSDKINDFTILRVKEIVATLMSTISIHPF